MLSWEPWEHASCARKGWQLGSAKDDRASSERFGREDSARAAWAATAAGGGGRSHSCVKHFCRPAVAVLVSVCCLSHEGSRLAQADRSGDVARAHAAAAQWDMK